MNRFLHWLFGNVGIHRPGQNISISGDQTKDKKREKGGRVTDRKRLTLLFCRNVFDRYDHDL